MRFSSILGWTTLAIAGVVFVLPILIVCLFVLWIVASENPRFAHVYFKDIMPISQVVASRRWHNAGYGCIYAIAELRPDAPSSPPPGTVSRRNWPIVWPDEWLPTPGPAFAANEAGDSVTLPVFDCAHEWSVEIGKELRRAMMTDGSFYSGGTMTEDFYIYAPTVGLAAYIRYGD